MSTWFPGRDRRAVRHPARPGAARTTGTPHRVLVAGGGIAGIAAAVGLAERGVEVTLVEPHDQLGGRVRSWPVEQDGEQVTMSRGFHAFFRQYYNLRSLLRRVDPDLDGLTPVPDYPLVMAGGHGDSFATIPRTPPLNLAAFVARSPSFPLRDLVRVNVPAALELLDVDFPATFSHYDGESAAQFLDRLRFPDGARHLALEVFARSFFAHPTQFSAGELVGMFHTYFVGSSEGLLFDVPTDDYDTVLWAPLRRYLQGCGVRVLTGSRVESIDLSTAQEVTVRVEDVDAGEDLVVDAVVLATDLGTTRRLVADAPGPGDQAWRHRIASTSNAPRFAVLRLWFDRLVNPERPAFLGTSGYGLLDNITVLERFEEGAARWSHEHKSSVVELHAYALPDTVDPDDIELQSQLRAQLGLVYPETLEAKVVSSQWVVENDCPLIDTSPWVDRPEVITGDPRVLLAGDGIRCDYPVALMERAATTGWLAANDLLGQWGLAGHDLWTVPMRGRVAAIRRVRKLFR
jgi:isorenieratene synthase